MSSKSRAFAAIFIGLALALIGGLVSGMLPQVIVGVGLPQQVAGVMMLSMLVAIGIVCVAAGGNGQVIIVAGTMAGFYALCYDQDPLMRYLTLAAVLFTIGFYGMVVSRNAVRVLMSIELMLNAVNINMVTFSHFIDSKWIFGQMFSVFILIVAAAEAAVGLAIVLAIYRTMSTVDMEKFDLLKW